MNQVSDDNEFTIEVKPGKEETHRGSSIAFEDAVMIDLDTKLGRIAFNLMEYFEMRRYKSYTPDTNKNLKTKDVKFISDLGEYERKK
jgi:hypothetical protein